MNNTNRFVSILSDYGFKATFGDEKNTLFLRTALQALIQSDTVIKEVKFLRNEFEGITIESRGGLYDIICEDEKGNTFIVEMQAGFYKNYIQRSKFYAFHRLNTMVKKGLFKYENLKKIYSIVFIGNKIFPKSELYYHFGTLKNQIGENLDDQITHVIVEISKFEKKLEDIHTNLDKLIYLMKNLETIIKEANLPPFLSEDWIEQALLKLDKVQMTPQQRMFFEMTMAKQASMLEMKQAEDKRLAKKAIKKGLKQGIKQGIEQGMKQGIEQGLVEGTQKATNEIAIKMKEKGMDVSIISELTGLTIETIEKL